MIVATDCGSTNMKAAVFTADGSRLAESSIPLLYTIRTGSRVEFSPEDTRSCFQTLMANLCQMAGISCHEIRKVCFTSQAQTFTVLDANGLPLSPFFGWADSRADKEAVELQARFGADFHRVTGLPVVSPKHMISKVLWWGRTHGQSRAMRFVSLPSYLAMQLGAAHVTDRNLAAMSGFYSIPDSHWWIHGLEAVGLEADQLGELTNPGQVLPKCRRPKCAGFSPDIEVAMAGNDHTAGALGGGCREGRPILTLGTAGVIYRHAGETPGPFSPAGLWGPYPGGGYYELLCLNHACSALDWADNILHGCIDSIRFVESIRLTHIREDSVLFYPDNWGSLRAWHGEGTLEEKAYAVLEGIGFALRRLAGLHFCAEEEKIMVLGGGSRLDGWVQLVANIFRRTLVRSDCDGLDGAATIAGVLATYGREHTICPELFYPDDTKDQLLERRYRRWSEFDLRNACIK